MVQTLKATRPQSRMGDPPKRIADVGKAKKRPTRAKTEPERFALHLAALLDDKGWTTHEFAAACVRAKLPIKEHNVRSWLRAENMPKSHHLRALGRVLELDDPRMILPE